MDSKIIGLRINRLLATKNVKQKELAKKLDVVDNVVSYWCKGTRKPNLEQIVEMADFFNVSTDYLLGVTNISTQNTEIRAICEYTGLSMESVERLHELNCDGVTHFSNGIISNRYSNTLISNLFYKEENEPFFASLLNVLRCANWYESHKDLILAFDSLLNNKKNISQDRIKKLKDDAIDFAYNVDIAEKDLKISKMEAKECFDNFINKIIDTQNIRDEGKIKTTKYVMNLYYAEREKELIKRAESELNDNGSEDNGDSSQG